MAAWALVSCLATLAGPVAAAAAPAPPTPEQVRALTQLLADPAVRQWLQQQAEAAPAAPPEEQLADGLSQLASARVEIWRSHIEELKAALPRLPGELAAAVATLAADLAGHAVPELILLLAAFGALGMGLELLARRLALRHGARREAAPAEASGRAQAVLGRLLVDVLGLLAFALGSIGAFLLFTWPPLLRLLVLALVLALLVVRCARLLLRFLLAPDRAELRLVPMDEAKAGLWYRWGSAFAAWLAIGFVVLELLRTLGVSLPVAEILAYVLGIGLLAMALRLIAASLRGPARVALATGAVLLWVAWVIGANMIFWALLIALTLPCLLRVAHRAVLHLFRAEDGSPEQQATSARAVLVDRAVRALLLVGGIGLLLRGWQLDLATLTREDTLVARLILGGLHALVILLVADLVWQLARVAIDRQLVLSGESGAELPEAERRRRARLRTVLPILRNLLWVSLAAVAVLMALSALGVQIAPLIAGAGVIGVAVGFGSQTLVKDIVSGMFYLLDDAFRVGEYIVSGNYRGTVEGFSLRSVRLRHHRGPVYTVPFGVLGAVQNLSRDWVIDKIPINVTYDTDLAKLKKVVKQVSADIMADPEMAARIIQPLKSQGVGAMGDFAIQIRLKYMAKPGEQFLVRRAVYDKIKTAFDRAGIKFAFPTVTVAGEPTAAATPAIAQQALSLAAPQHAAG
ncbi:MAG: mechanosensitive ion channel family protein [Geminicoccaceae bacterium]